MFPVVWCGWLSSPKMTRSRWQTSHFQTCHPSEEGQGPISFQEWDSESRRNGGGTFGLGGFGGCFTGPTSELDADAPALANEVPVEGSVREQLPDDPALILDVVVLPRRVVVGPLGTDLD